MDLPELRHRWLSSAYVATGKLIVALSEIDEVKADEVIHLKPQKRSLFRLLLASALRSLWASLTAHVFNKETGKIIRPAV